MAEFISAFHKTAQIEGGFADHPNDRGGMTFCGIARQFHPDWPGWVWVDAALRSGKNPDTLRGHATVQRLIEDFYRGNFWTPLSLGEFPQLLADELYDSAVNLGVKCAALWLQRTTNLLTWEDWPLFEDGVVGPRTINAARAAYKKHGAQLFYKVLNGLQFAKYYDLAMTDRREIEKNPTFPPRWIIFFRGWVSNRVFEVM